MSITAPVITQLKLATVHLPDDHPDASGDCDVFGYLIEDDDACLLIDTGVGSHQAIDSMYGPVRSCFDALDTSRVTAVVNSHLHFDHCGNNRAFPGVPIYVQAAELAAAREPGYTVRDWVDFEGANYVVVEGRFAITANVELIPSPGHTPGHQSVAVRTGSGLELIVAQAAYTADVFARGSPVALHQLAPTKAYFSHDARCWTPSWKT